MTNYGIKRTTIRDLSGPPPSMSHLGNAHGTAHSTWPAGGKGKPHNAQRQTDIQTGEWETKKQAPRHESVLGNKIKFYRIIKSQDAATSSLFYYTRPRWLLLSFSTLLLQEPLRPPPPYNWITLLIIIIVRPHVTVVGFIVALLCASNHCLPPYQHSFSILLPQSGESS